MRLPALLSGLLLTVALNANAAPLRVASFNTSLYSEQSGGLQARLRSGDDGARKIAAVIQQQRPSIVLLNEFDYDPKGIAARLFMKQYLSKSQFGQKAIRYRYHFYAPVNTGVQSGFDLNNDGRIGGGNDAFGFGLHPGQYGMLVLSQFPIDVSAIRTFQNFLWKDMPGARMPIKADGSPWYSSTAWNSLRLSSKSHWDVPIKTPIGTIHLLASHPTPPVFDGAEDRNGKRNADEIRFWSEYLSTQDQTWIIDDKGRRGGLAANARFVIAGDLNADPVDGDGIAGTMVELLENSRVLRMATPSSEGGIQSAQLDAGANLKHRGSPRHDTGKFGPTVGNLRLDYVLPSVGLGVKASGVFWPKTGEFGAEWLDATDHRMVWVDLMTPNP